MAESIWLRAFSLAASAEASRVRQTSTSRAATALVFCLFSIFVLAEIVHVFGIASNAYPWNIPRAHRPIQARSAF